MDPTSATGQERETSSKNVERIPETRSTRRSDDAPAPSWPSPDRPAFLSRSRAVAMRRPTLGPAGPGQRPAARRPDSRAATGWTRHARGSGLLVHRPHRNVAQQRAAPQGRSVGSDGLFAALARSAAAKSPSLRSERGTIAAFQLKRRPDSKGYRFRRATMPGVSLPSPSWGQRQTRHSKGNEVLVSRGRSWFQTMRGHRAVRKARDALQDLIGRLQPDERLGIIVCRDDIRLDCLA